MSTSSPRLWWTPQTGVETVVYRHRTGELITLPHNAALPVSLEVLEFDIVTITPIKAFGPLDLINMYNTGGAVEGLTYQVRSGAQVESGPAHGEGVENRGDEVVGKVHMEVKGCGMFGAYSSAKPRRCWFGSKEVEFVYDFGLGLTLKLDQMPDGSRKVHIVEVEL